MIILSDNAIVKIKAAESQAAQIRENATAEARQKVAAAETSAAETVNDRLEAAEKSADEQLATIAAKAEQIAEKSRREAISEAVKLKSEAEPRIRTAVKRIIWGILEQCQ